MIDVVVNILKVDDKLVCVEFNRKQGNQLGFFEFFKKTKCIKNEVVVTFGLLVGHEKLAKNCDKTNVFFDVITRDVVTDFQTSFH